MLLGRAQGLPPHPQRLWPDLGLVRHARGCRKEGARRFGRALADRLSSLSQTEDSAAWFVYDTDGHLVAARSPAGAGGLATFVDVAVLQGVTLTNVNQAVVEGNLDLS